MKICVVGLGYIGLPTAAVFSQAGCEVYGVDKKTNVVETLSKGKIHIEEPGLDEIIANRIGNNFNVGLKPQEADAFIISVPTPNKEDEFLSCDLTYVLDACKSILPVLKQKNVVIVESTIAPRSMDDYVKPIFENAGYIIGETLYLAHCPERVLPGQILHELVYNNRIVGGITLACTEKAAEVYGQVVKGEILKTEAKTAELSKCMENTFRDVNIALANELAKICYKLDINCLDVIAMANKHPRVNIHHPGPGVGGHCLAIDPYFICAQVPEEARIIRLSRDTNRSMPFFVVDKIEMLVANIENPKIALLGMAYKGNVDDLRESPSMEVASILKEKGYHIVINEPHVKEEQFVTIEEAIKDADLAVILTDHDEYRSLNCEKIAMSMRTPQLFDTRNIVLENKSDTLTVINYGNLYQYKK